MNTNTTASFTMTVAQAVTSSGDGWSLTIFKMVVSIVMSVVSVLFFIYMIKIALQMMERVGQMKHGIRVHDPTMKIMLRRIFCRHRYCSIIMQKGFKGLFCTLCGKRIDVGQEELQR